MIEFENVSKVYNPGLFKKKNTAVNDLTLNIHAGEVFGLIGPNGAGKSTSIRMLLGLIRPDSGHIFFRGKPLSETCIQSEVGYLPENPYLYDHLTLIELLRFCGQTSGLNSDYAQERGQTLMLKMNLFDARKRPLRTFSKGMLQRAGICFALLHDPSLVVLDEPMSGLDPLGRKMVFDLVGELKEQGKTIFFCSHILSDVERLCDRIGLLCEGRLVDIFESQTLTSSRVGQVHLRVGFLDRSQRETLEAKQIRVVDCSEGHTLTVVAERLPELSQLVVQSGINVLGSREDSLTLEELFLRVVQGEQQ